MDDNSKQQKLIGFIFLIFVLLTYKQMIWDPYFSKDAKKAQTAALQGETAPVNAQTPSATSVGQPTVGQPQPVVQQAKSSSPTDADFAAAGEVNVRTDRHTLSVNLLGGRISKLSLNNYAETNENDSPRLSLVEHREGTPLPLGVYLGNQDDSWVRYTVDGGNELSVGSGEKKELLLRGQLADGRQITKRLTFDGGSYLIGVSVEVAGDPAGQPALELEWSRVIPKDSQSWLDPYQTSGYVWFDDERAQREQFSKVPGEVQDFGKIRWAAFTDKYFAVSILSAGEMMPARALAKNEIYRARMSGAADRGEFQIFAGPKDYKMLEDYGFGLERLIDFGRLGFLSAPLLMLLRFFHSVLGNWGLAIVALTILVRLCMLPLTAASFKQMKAMQDLQPEMQRIRETIADKQQQQMQMMELYKKKGVNPMGGCFPILLQLPIFLGLYNALMMAIELRHAHYALWITDLSAPEFLDLFGIGVPVMVGLLVLSMLAQQWLTPTAMDPAQKKAMLIVPIIFGVMFVNFPAGLSLYWLVGNIVAIAQSYALKAEGGKSPFLVTSAVSLGTFLLAYGVALIG